MAFGQRMKPNIVLLTTLEQTKVLQPIEVAEVKTIKLDFEKTVYIIDAVLKASDAHVEGSSKLSIM